MLKNINNYFSISELIFKVTNLFFLIGILMSFNLWFQLNRPIPYISIINFHHQNLLSVIIALGLVLLFVFNIYKFKTITVVISLSLLLALLVLDRMKWQPWVYFYGLVLVAYTQKTPKHGYYVVKYLIGVMYVWAGIQKINPTFVSFISAYAPNRLENYSDIIALIPYGEILLGVVLIIFPLTKLSRHIFALFHLFLIVFVLLFNRKNSIIIPWNLYFIVIIYLLYYGNKHADFINPLISNKIKLLLSVFALLPVLHFYSKLDSYLAFNLYSGKGKQYFLVFKKNDITERVKKQFNSAFLAPSTTKSLIKKSGNYDIVSFYRHSLNTMNVPPVVEDDVITFLNAYYHLKFPKGRPVAY